MHRPSLFSQVFYHRIPAMSTVFWKIFMEFSGFFGIFITDPGKNKGIPNQKEVPP